MFTCTKGEQFWVDGEVVFPPGDEDLQADGTYRSMFGPGASHSGVILADTDSNFRLALRRLTCKRELDTPGYHWYLRYAQISFLRHHQRFIDHLAELYKPVLMQFTNSVDEAELHHADPHNKRELRIRAYDEQIEKGVAYDEQDPWMQGNVTAKAKRDEYMKPNKYGRCIFDFKTPASLVGFRLCNFVKQAQLDSIVHINGGTIEFCKSPDPTQLARIFRTLHDPPGRFYFIYFSDDSCLAVRKPTCVEWYNLDIKSCDSSHTGALFQAMRNAMPPHCHNAFDLLIKQCSTKIKVTSRGNREHYVKLKPFEPLLMSGTTLTGAINGFANTLIAYSISLLDDITGPGMVEAAARVGYVLTGCDKPLTCFEEVQFLKHSPVLDTDGQWQPMLNLGVLIRASGSCHGDLPGRGEIEPRARLFQAQLLHGAYPYTACKVLDTMRLATRVATPLITSIPSVLQHKVTPEALHYPPYRALDSSVYRRYNLSPSHISDLENVYAPMEFGQWYHGPSVSSILSLDYGLTTVSGEDHAWLGQARLLHDGLFSNPGV
jgi:hypothetical protein